MTTQALSFPIFARRLQSKSIAEILIDINDEIRHTEGRLSGQPGARERRARGDFDYVRKLKSLLNFLYTNQRPHALTLADLHAIKPALRGCIERGELSPSTHFGTSDL